MTVVDAATLAAVAEAEARLRNPLEYWRTSSEPQEYTIRQFFDGVWVYAHAANRSGKTWGIAAAVCALLTGRQWLWGEPEFEGGPPLKIPVPLVEPGVIGILGGPTYKILSIGAVDAIRTLLGRRGTRQDCERDPAAFDYCEDHAGSPDNVSLFTVKHRLASGFSQWSKLYVFPYDGPLPEGPGVDFWWTNEPPPDPYLRALKNRKRADRITRRVIDATPRKREVWGPIRALFPAEARKVVGGRVRIQWPFRVNRALSPEDIAQLERDNIDDPQWKAISEGDHVDTTGICPFATDLLEDALRDAVGGERYGVILAPAEEDWEEPVYRLQRHARGNIECWNNDKRGRFIVASDPSSGVYDYALAPDRQKRNPSCINVVSEDRGEQVFRFNGYVTAHELGIMSRAICTYLTNDDDEPLWIPEMNGGWGEAMMVGFGEGYSNIWRPVRRSNAKGKASAQFGWNQTGATRGLLFGSLQRAILEGWIKFRSPDCLKNLLAVKLDDKDRPDQGDGTGAHAEDAITSGMIAYAMEHPQERIRRDAPQSNREVVERAAGIERNGVDHGETVDRWR